MADNIISNIGDVLIVRIEPKITGKIRFTGYTETIENETEERSLKREFRISQDGVFWTDWATLNIDNLSSEEYFTDSYIQIEIRYTRTGTDESGDIVFKSIDFNGTRKSIQFDAPTLQSSIFRNIIGTNVLATLERNIFKKLYYRGILPDYIKRAENSSYNEDKDFVDLFYSIARFFSILISFFRRWENFRNDEDLLREQVRGYGIYFNENDITLSELKYIAQNILSQAQQRGTEMIFKRKGVAPIDGEFIRLTRNRICDELLYEYIPIYKIGWCLGNSSPIYKGTAMAYNLNKTKENTKDFQSLSNFVLSKSGTGSYSLQNTDNKRVIRLSATSYGTGHSAIGRIDSNINVGDNIYSADSQLDYEITFAFKINSGTNLSKLTLNFGVEGFDINKEKLNDAFSTVDGFQVSENFFDQSMNIWKIGQWYYARGIIHAYSSENVIGGKTNLGIGKDLVFNNSFVKYIIPKIEFYTKTAQNASIDIYDYKIRPLIRGKNILPLKNGSIDSHGLGFIQGSKILYTYVRNNNNGQSEDEIIDIIERYLYPFNTVNMFTITGNK